MTPFEEAQEIILAHVRPLEAEEVPLERSCGRYLAEPVVADLDVPPFDRSAMDGFAVDSADLATGEARLEVVETIAAGQTPRRRIARGRTARIMTGAPIPEGADSVVMVENSRELAAGWVHLADTPAPGQHIRRRGEEMRGGETILQPGRFLRPTEIGVLATAGRARVRVGRRPRVVVCSTGDELTPVNETPAPGSIRESNTYVLAALGARFGAEIVASGVVRDRPEDLDAALRRGFGHDVAVFSGGVSMGELDLVGKRMRAAGVEILVERIALKPGKPLVFGVHAPSGTLLFGLPGNPVSSLATFWLMAAPALRRLQGASDPLPAWGVAELTREVRARPDRTEMAPALLEPGAPWRATPIGSRGSADMLSWSRADGVVELRSGGGPFPAGTRVRSLRFFE